LRNKVFFPAAGVPDTSGMSATGAFSSSDAFDPEADKKELASEQIRAKLWQMAKPEWRLVVVCVVSCLVATGAALLQPLWFGKILSLLADPALNNQALFKLATQISLVYTIEATMTFFYVSRATRLIENVGARLKKDVFSQVISRDVAFFDMNSPSEVTAIIASEIDSVKKSARDNLRRDRGIRAVLEVTAGLTILFNMAPNLAWLFAIVIPTSATLVARMGKKVIKAAMQEAMSSAVEQGITGEVVRNIREVKSFGSEGKEQRRFEAQVDKTSGIGRAMGVKSGRMEATSRSAIYISILSTVWWGGQLVAAGKLSVPVMISFIGYCFSLNFAILGANFTYSDFERSMASLRKVQEIVGGNEGPKTLEKANLEKKLDVAEEPLLEENKDAPVTVHGKVEFRDVGFSYPARPDVRVMKGINLTLEKGSVTALVGPSGAGKSTIGALLSRYYAPTRGRLLIDDTPIGDLPNDLLTKEIALVSQGASLFSGTLASNIAYGIEGATPEQIENAARVANAHDFIEDFPQGYETTVGEGGVSLSGGQRQRIAIARAVLKDSKILILDEATSALDAESEAAVQTALDRLVKGRTVLVIAHRLSTVVNADKICVVGGGQITEEGTHRELLKLGGAYSQLMKTQVGSYSAGSEVSSHSGTQVESAEQTAMSTV